MGLSLHIFIDLSLLSCFFYYSPTSSTGTMYRNWAATDDQTHNPSQYSASPYSNSNHGATYDSGQASGSGSGYGSGYSHGQGYSAPQPMASSPSPYASPLGPSPLTSAYAQASAAYSDIERGSTPGYGSGSGSGSGSGPDYGSGPMPMQPSFTTSQGQGAPAPSYTMPAQHFQYQQQQQKQQRAPAYPALKTPIISPIALHSVSHSALHSASHSTSPAYTTPQKSLDRGLVSTTLDFDAYQDDKEQISKTDDRTLTPRSDSWDRQWCIYTKHVDLHFNYKAKANDGQINVLAIGFEFNQRTRGTSGTTGITGILIWQAKQALMRIVLSAMGQPHQPFKLKLPQKASERYTGDFYDPPNHMEEYPTLKLHLEHCSLERLQQLLDLFCKCSNINRRDVAVLEQCYIRGLPRAQVIRAAMDQHAQKRSKTVRTYEIPQLELKRGEELKLEMKPEDRAKIIDKMFTEYTAVHGLNGFSRPEAKQRWLSRLKDSAIDHYIKTGEI